MAETRCPACAHSPIPAGAESCPRCDEPFNFLPMYKRGQRRFQDTVDESEVLVTSTAHGSLSGALSHHPGPATAALFLGALLWTARGLGFVGVEGEASLSFIVAGLDVVLALTLLLNLGPVKVVVQAGMVLQLLFALYLAQGRNELSHLFFGLHALAVLAMTAGEPGAVRRWAGLLSAAVFAAGVFATHGRRSGAAEEEAQISSSTLGFSLRLPAPARTLKPNELSPMLELPAATLTGESFGFGEAGADVTGVVTAERHSDAALSTRCGTLHRELGGRNAPRPVAKEAPAALGTGALSYELVTSASTGYLSCARFDDGRFYGFAVTVKDRTAAQATFDRLGAGLIISTQ